MNQQKMLAAVAQHIVNTFLTKRRGNFLAALEPPPYSSGFSSLSNRVWTAEKRRGVVVSDERNMFVEWVTVKK